MRPVSSFLDLSGTATRRTALIALGLLLLVGFGGGLLAELSPPVRPYMVAALGLTGAATASVLVRRLHDAGRSGLWVLATAVPVLGLAAAAVIALLPQRRAYLSGHPGLRAFGAALLVLIVFLSLARLIWSPYLMVSGSMKPTLLVGDYVWARLVGPSGMARGDVVIFRHPVTGIEHVGRLIGLPGDRVQMRDGAVALNEAPVPQTGDGDFVETYRKQGPQGVLPLCANGPVGVGAACRKARLIETLPDGRRYAVLDTGRGAADNTQVFTVPAGRYFLLGDNRDNSLDSRFAGDVGGVGMVGSGDLVGRVDRVMVSTAGRSLWSVWDWRSDRMFRSVE